MGSSKRFLEHFSPLDRKQKDKRRGKWKFMPHGRDRMDAAAKSDDNRKHGGNHGARGESVQVGSTRADDAALWAIAKVRAESLIEKMEDEGLLPDLSGVIVPGSDQELAKAALVETARIALGPVDKRTKMDALKTLLNYTKQKPAQAVEAKVSSMEAWLSEIEKDA